MTRFSRNFSVVHAKCAQIFEICNHVYTISQLVENCAGGKRSRLREREKEKEIESVRERLSVRKRKVEVIDRWRDTLLRIMLVKGVESWGKDRKRESCNLYIKASIERVFAVLPKREEEIRARIYSPCRCVPLRATTCAKCLANPG